MKRGIMRRRHILSFLTATLLGPAAWAQSPAPRRIGILFPGHLGARRLELITAGVRSVLPEMPPEIHHRSAAGDTAALHRLARELVDQRVNVILAIGSAALHTTYSASRTMPIVALDLETDPVSSGLVASFARPGGTVTGIFFDAPEVAGKWFQLMRDTVPRLTRVGLLFDAHTDQAQMRAAEQAARADGAQTVRLPVGHPDRLPDAFMTASAARAEALLVHSSPLFVDHAERIGQLALEHKLPSVGLFPVSAAAGALLAYGPDNFALLPRAGMMAAKVVRGASPAELAIERPSVFKLVVNLRTAKVLGLTIPSVLVANADEVIE